MKLCYIPIALCLCSLSQASTVWSEEEPVIAQERSCATRSDASISSLMQVTVGVRHKDAKASHHHVQEIQALPMKKDVKATADVRQKGDHTNPVGAQGWKPINHMPFSGHSTAPVSMGAQHNILSMPALVVGIQSRSPVTIALVVFSLVGIPIVLMMLYGLWFSGDSPDAKKRQSVSGNPASGSPRMEERKPGAHDQQGSGIFASGSQVGSHASIRRGQSAPASGSFLESNFPSGIYTTVNLGSEAVVPGSQAAPSTVGSLSETLPCIGAAQLRQPSMPEQLFNSVLVAPEGLSLTMYGPHIEPIQQRCTLTVHMKNPGGSMQHVMDVIVAEQTEDKGVLIQSGENLPVCYLDTRQAVRSKTFWGSSSSKGRFVNIYDFIPENIKTAGNPNVTVKESGHRSFDMYPIMGNGAPGKLWYKIQFLDDCANFLDAQGRLQANMKLKQRDGEEKCMYVIEISPNVDASVILSGLISVIKLS